MRNFYLLLSALLFLSETFCFGQSEWGTWTQHPCYSGIYVRGKKSYFNKLSNKWFWDFQMQNNYNVTVAVCWRFYDEADGVPTKANTTMLFNQKRTLKPHEIYSNNTPSGTERLAYLMGNICFSFKNVNGTLVDQCSDNPTTTGYSAYYAECDNGTPNFKTAFEVPNNSTFKTITQTPSLTLNNNSPGSNNLQQQQELQRQQQIAQQQLIQQQELQKQELQKQQQLKQQQELQKQQQIAQGVTEIATGIVDLISSFKADKELRIAKEKEAAIAKSNADRQFGLDLENGVYEPQMKMADKYFDERNYSLAESYYLKALESTNVKNDEKYSLFENLISTFALQGKKKEIFDLFNYNKAKKIKSYDADETLAFLQLHCDEFCPDYLNCNDSIAIVKAIKEIEDHYWNDRKRLLKYAEAKNVLYAYFQVIGKYEKYGIPKDEKLGLELLEKTKAKKDDWKDPKSSCAYYYLGLIYLNGTSTIAINEKKALEYFKKGYNRPEKVYHLAPYYIYYHGTTYFNYALLNYIKIAGLYSKSKDKDESELGRKMLEAYYTFYKDMIPNSDKEYFKDYFKQ